MQRAARFVGWVAILATLATGVACRGSSNADDDGGDDDTTIDAGAGTTIYDVQNDAMPVGTPVTLKGVVVTALDPNGPGVYVQDPQGGPYSGILVYKPAVDGTLAIGDIVTVDGGVKYEFMYNGGTSGMPDDKSLTQLMAPDGGSVVITKTGTGEAVANVVDPIALAASEDEAEKWESVLVRFENVAVVGAPRDAGSSRELRVTGPFRVQNRLTPLSVGGTEFVLGDCFVSITGVVNYFYDYKLLPRSEADYATGGTSCPAPEADATSCADGTDNDHNGFADCQDFSCQSVAGLDCTVSTSIVDIQNGTVGTNAPVKLTDVVITAIDLAANGDRVWVADAATGAAFNGVLLFKPTVTGGTTADLAIGDVVDAEGRVTEFNGLTEITGSVADPVTITKKGTNTLPTPLVVALTTVADPAMAEQYEGVLIVVANGKVSSVNPDAAGGTSCPNNDCGEYTISSGAATLRIDDLIFQSRGSVALDACLGSVTGVLDFAFGNYKLLPRSAADLVAGGGVCN